MTSSNRKWQPEVCQIGLEGPGGPKEACYWPLRSLGRVRGTGTRKWEPELGTGSENRKWNWEQEVGTGSGSGNRKWEPGLDESLASPCKLIVNTCQSSLNYQEGSVNRQCGWMDGRMNGWMDKELNEWMDRWMDE